MKKTTNYRLYIAAGSFFLVIFLIITLLSVGYTNNRKIIEKQKTEIDSLKRYNKQLAGINGINVEVVFNLNQKNVLSFSANNCQNIAREVAHMTRGEIYDSITKKDILK